ncbi:MAG: hypothetical protein GTO45_27220 [Candidatus Aminicenantes bacterium]|nr:hypothetical protein [Candidatus Aminicenantes bacterium]NIM82473.1 hypothetical protein [Candidatus Aminicenantes bacterium]NIN21848.1 hypothetical protein [Candidatus Aminicenantes bacterium]NIN45626.1 hypothetical protein [Candidatus Aminicenantes bacterium]NIN88460.1 hypothetical protein [Candidatus Aminicenantes bacterium]
MADKEMLLIKNRKGQLEYKWGRAKMEPGHFAVVRGTMGLRLCAVPPATTTIPTTGTTTMGFVCAAAPRPIMPDGIASIAWQRLHLMPVFYGTPDWFSGMTCGSSARVTLPAAGRKTRI